MSATRTSKGTQSINQKLAVQAIYTHRTTQTARNVFAILHTCVNRDIDIMVPQYMYHSHRDYQ